MIKIAMVMMVELKPYLFTFLYLNENANIYSEKKFSNKNSTTL